MLTKKQKSYRNKVLYLDIKPRQEVEIMRWWQQRKTERRKLAEKQQKEIDEFYPKVLDALGNKTRRKIMELLSWKNARKTFTEIQANLGLKDDAQFERHVQKLRNAGLIVTIVFPHGKCVNCRISQFGAQIMGGVGQAIKNALKNWLPGT